MTKPRKIFLPTNQPFRYIKSLRAKDRADLS